MMRMVFVCSMALALFSLCLVPVHVDAANTYVFQLTRNGTPMGKLGVEVAQANGGAIKFRCKNEVGHRLETHDMLKHIAAEKSGRIDFSQPNKLVRLEEGQTRWKVSSTSRDVRITRYVGTRSRPMDDLMINPVLPVYDFISLLIVLQENKHSGSFDFYLLEKGHQKRLRMEKSLFGDEWTLKYRNRALAAFTVEPGNALEVDFDKSDFYAREGFRLKYLCQNPGGLEEVRAVRPREILEAYIKKHGDQYTSLSRACSCRFSRNRRHGIIATCKDCLKVERPVTRQVKNYFVGGLIDLGIISKAFDRNSYAVKWDAEKGRLCPVWKEGAAPVVEQEYNVSDDNTRNRFWREHGIVSYPRYVNEHITEMKRDGQVFHRVSLAFADEFCIDVAEVKSIIQKSSNVHMTSEKIVKRGKDFFLEGFQTLQLTEGDIRSLLGYSNRATFKLGNGALHIRYSNLACPGEY